jgi:hypothetical protein
MLEDLRGHDPNPTVREREWMDFDANRLIVRLMVLAGIAVLVGMAATQGLVA